MSLGDILRIALADTVLGMGTVFVILIFISLCIWLLGVACRERKPAAQAAAAAAAAPAVSEEPEGLRPEVVAAITAAIHEHLKAQNEDVDTDEYIIRNVRRATWRHTS